MPKLSGAFDQFSNLQRIKIEEINHWIKPKQDPKLLTNFLGNRILYPQTIALTKQEMDIDLAILRAAIKKEPLKFYDPKLKKINIPQDFVNRFHPQTSLTAAFVDSLELNNVSQVFITEASGKKLATAVIVPQTLPEKGQVDTVLGNQKFKLKLNTLTLLPVVAGTYNLVVGQNPQLTINTGSLGIFIDLRRKNYKSI